MFVFGFIYFLITQRFLLLLTTKQNKLHCALIRMRKQTNTPKKGVELLSISNTKSRPQIAAEHSLIYLRKKWWNKLIYSIIVRYKRVERTCIFSSSFWQWQPLVLDSFERLPRMHTNEQKSGIAAIIMASHHRQTSSQPPPQPHHQSILLVIHCNDRHKCKKWNKFNKFMALTIQNDSTLI